MGEREREKKVYNKDESIICFPNHMLLRMKRSY
jgi:hypothetical protein